MGCYLSPDYTLKIESVVAALKERPRGAEVLVEGDFNVKLLESEGDERGEYTVSSLATEILEDMLAHSILRRRSWCWDWRIWSMIRAGREVRPRTDYILGMD